MSLIMGMEGPSRTCTELSGNFTVFGEWSPRV